MNSQLIDAYFDSYGHKCIMETISPLLAVMLAINLAKYGPFLYSKYKQFVSKSNASPDVIQKSQKIAAKGVAKFKEAKAKKSSIKESVELTESVSMSIINTFVSAFAFFLKAIWLIISASLKTIVSGLGITAIFALLLKAIYSLGKFAINTLIGFVDFLFKAFSLGTKTESNGPAIRKRIREKNIQIAKSIASKADSKDLKERAIKVANNIQSA